MSATDLQYLAESMRVGRKPHWTEDLADHILSLVSDKSDEVVASRHPLGFVHCELSPYVDLPGHRLRLHIWSDATNEWIDDAGLKHDHTWGLTSLVLRGSLRDHVLEVVPDTQGDWQFMSVKYGSLEDILTPEGSHLTYRVIDTRALIAGDVYALAPGLLHETEVLTRPTVTLVLAAVSPEGSPRLLAPREVTHILRTRRSNLTAGELKDFVSGVRSAPF